MAKLNGHEGGNAGDGQAEPNAPVGSTNRSAERVEGRRQAKGNVEPADAFRTQDRGDAPSRWDRIRRAARADKERRFTTLLHHVYSIDTLSEAYFGLKREAAPGIDGETWQAYGQQLESNLHDLSARLQRGAYRARPVRRVFIPKPDGRQRPLGVTALEDKVVQRALVMVLNCIYEEDFLGFSYGFRPGRKQHDALDALAVATCDRKVNWVLDADIRGFFDSISHEWLVKFIGRRVADKRVVHLIQKWLNAGVLTDGTWTSSEVGTPQGGVISPLLANIFLHYAFDLWIHEWRKRAKGDVIVVRYADDFIVGFQYEWEAKRFLTELREQLAAHGLELHPDKTRLIEFGRFAAENRDRDRRGKPDTFDFLGFTHVCSKTKAGRFTLRRLTMRKRLRAKLLAVKLELRKRWHQPIRTVAVWLASVIRGHLNYYAVPLNSERVAAFRYRVIVYWRRALNRRSDKANVTWTRMRRMARALLPPARVVHPWPNQRFAL